MSRCGLSLFLYTLLKISSSVVAAWRDRVGVNVCGTWLPPQVFTSTAVAVLQACRDATHTQRRALTKVSGEERCPLAAGE